MKIGKLKEELERVVENFSKKEKTRSNIDEYIMELCREIEKACKNSTFGKSKRSWNPVWWGIELQTLRSKVRALRSRFQSTLEEPERGCRRQIFKKNLAILKREVNSTKKED